MYNHMRMSRRGIGTPRCCDGLYGRIGPVDTYMRMKICVCNHVSTHWWHVCLPWQTMPFASLLDIENPALAPTIELVLASDIFAYLSRNGLGTLVCGMGHFLVSFILASEQHFHSGIKVTTTRDCDNHTILEVKSPWVRCRRNYLCTRAYRCGGFSQLSFASYICCNY